LKKLAPHATALLRLIERWRNEAVSAGRPISRIALAYHADRGGLWLVRRLIAREIEAPDALSGHRRFRPRIAGTTPSTTIFGGSYFKDENQDSTSFRA
jgi:hypothetical protein